ncbi:hypothetical protein Back11_11420 [Paenibacillus baekrokdamisoli]|uniref:Uncharacterized protein n=1 Tax=Paenibacillus baekrokdamisoli TaxID=1712516 RepID=A0A3G9ILH5_9BACL|nr:hypothetical protein [Paenibacillus baekrokdamisoli]MBB3070443.1 hypothetical protein [Paenibacillus baekrokdamisoli]BBH19797.1 hypothetical protein Back11_11420 [Paenibacillus baekrokdamisoli]
MPRDLEADLAICEAATPGPYEITTCDCGSPVCSQVFISITNTEGRLFPEDAAFYVAARNGWPETIRELQAAEAKIDRLQNELQLYQEQLQQSRGCGD